MNQNLVLYQFKGLESTGGIKLQLFLNAQFPACLVDKDEKQQD